MIFKDKTVIVTGGSEGVGAAAARSGENALKPLYIRLPLALGGVLSH